MEPPFRYPQHKGNFAEFFRYEQCEPDVFERIMAQEEKRKV
jgi:hypothetical protein